MSNRHRREDPGAQLLGLTKEVKESLPEAAGALVRLMQDLLVPETRLNRLAQLRRLTESKAALGLAIFSKGEG